MKTILVTAFEPFGGESMNASLEVLSALPDTVAGAKIEKAILPVEFYASAREAVRAAEELRPDAIVCLGQAGGRSAVTPERVGINLMDARIPDNAGFRPRDLPILPEGPAACFATLPLRAMTEAMAADRVPAQISNTAGTYVCNSLLYSMLHYTAEKAPGTPCGFIHVPWLNEQEHKPEAPSLPKETVVRGILDALETLVSFL